MKVLSIGTDRNIFEENSEVRERQIEYGSLFDELHIIVFCLKKQRLTAKKISENVSIYPTNSWNRWFYILGAKRIGKKILETKKDTNWTISSQDPFETGLAAFWLSKANVKLNVQIHTNLFNPNFRALSFLNKVRFYLAKRIILKAHSIRVVSKQIKNSLLSLYPTCPPKPWRRRKPNILGPITVLPMFIDVQKIISARSQFYLRDRYPQFDFIILIVARLEAEKNISQAIRVAKEVVREFPKTGFVIVGDGQEKDRLKKQAQKFKIEKNIKFEGWQTDVVSYYKSADLLLHTSFFEGFNRSLFEAAASGCPIVTTAVSPADEFLTDEKDVLICGARDTACFAHKIGKLIKDKNYRKFLAENSKNVVAQNAIDKKEYLSLYKKAVTLSNNTS